MPGEMPSVCDGPSRCRARTLGDLEIWSIGAAPSAWRSQPAQRLDAQHAIADRPAMDRDEAITRIRAGLRRRTGREWSVTGGRGTAYGWITITAPPRRRVDSSGNPLGAKNATGRVVDQDDAAYMSEVDRTDLAVALGLQHPSHTQGETVAASSGHRVEYIDRAEGRVPSTIGERYWD